jgi:prophage regulatory protein
MQVPAPREDEPGEAQRTKPPQKRTQPGTSERRPETDRLLRLRSVLDIIPVSKSTFYSGIAAGRFPGPVKLGRNSFWRLSEILSVIERGTK